MGEEKDLKMKCSVEHEGKSGTFNITKFIKMHQMTMNNYGGLKCDNERLPNSHGLPCRHMIDCKKGAFILGIATRGN